MWQLKYLTRFQNHSKSKGFKCNWSKKKKKLGTIITRKGSPNFGIRAKEPLETKLKTMALHLEEEVDLMRKGRELGRVNAARSSVR